MLDASSGQRTSSGQRIWESRIRTADDAMCI
jgi:hypothetical protein